MLLTLTASCLRPLLTPAARGKKPKIELLDLPVYTRDTLGLGGLNLSTDLLAGADRSQLENIRERADKASCAVLLLVENEPQALASPDEAVAKAAVLRMTKVVEAAQIMGCASAAVKVVAENSDAGLLRAAARLKPVVERAEKLDINVLLGPHAGLTDTPEKLTDLIKKVGGFRIGTYPDFEAASKAKDPITYLRRLTPYASAVCGSTLAFKPAKPAPKPAKGSKKKGKEEPLPDAIEQAIEAALADLEEDMVHDAYDLASFVEAVESVGYDGSLGIDYRGPGDPAVGIVHTRNAFLSALHDEAPMDLDDEALEDEPEGPPSAEGEEE